MKYSNYFVSFVIAKKLLSSDDLGRMQTFQPRQSRMQSYLGNLLFRRYRLALVSRSGFHFSYESVKRFQNRIENLDKIRHFFFGIASIGFRQFFVFAFARLNNFIKAENIPFRQNIDLRFGKALGFQKSLEFRRIKVFRIIVNKSFDFRKFLRLAFRPGKKRNQIRILFIFR